MLEEVFTQLLPHFSDGLAAGRGCWWGVWSERVRYRRLYKSTSSSLLSSLRGLAVVPREKPHTGAAAREQPRDPPVIAR